MWIERIPQQQRSQVIAAGSVMNGPGAELRSKRSVSARRRGQSAEPEPVIVSNLTKALALCKMGLLAATTMMANTNKGSVKLRVSR